MHQLLTAFSSESGLKGCRVRLCPGRDGSAKRERSSALACWPLRMPEDWGRGRRGAGGRPDAVPCRSTGSRTQRSWYAVLLCGILDGVGCAGEEE
jgi:hypothetical protein